MKTLLANGLSTFSIKNNPFLAMVLVFYLIIPPDCRILYNWAFDNFILAVKPFAEALQGFETCILVNNNLRGKLFLLSELPTRFDERFKVTSVLFFNRKFNWLSCELDV